MLPPSPAEQSFSLGTSRMATMGPEWALVADTITPFTTSQSMTNPSEEPLTRVNFPITLSCSNRTLSAISVTVFRYLTGPPHGPESSLGGHMVVICRFGSFASLSAAELPQTCFSVLEDARGEPRPLPEPRPPRGGTSSMARAVGGDMRSRSRSKRMRIPPLWGSKTSSAPSLHPSTQC